MMILTIAVSVCVVSNVSQLLSSIVFSSLLELAVSSAASIVRVYEQNYGIVIIVADVQSECSLSCNVIISVTSSGALSSGKANQSALNVGSIVIETGYNTAGQSVGVIIACSASVIQLVGLVDVMGAIGVSRVLYNIALSQSVAVLNLQVISSVPFQTLVVV